MVGKGDTEELKCVRVVFIQEELFLFPLRSKHNQFTPFSKM